MDDDEVQLLKMVEIKKVLVNFTQLEESQYREVEDELRPEMMKLIENKSDNDLVEAEDEKQEIQEGIDQLKERLISCGEHSEDLRSKNCYNKVIYDPVNVLLRRILVTKHAINGYLRNTITNLYLIAETYWMKDNFAAAAECYDKLVDILMSVEKLNILFVERVEDAKTNALQNGENREEDSVPCNKEGKTGELSRKRVMRNEERLPQKIRKLENGEEEKDIFELKAEKEMAWKKRQAMDPIVVDCLMLLHGFSCMEELSLEKRVAAKMTEVTRKLGVNGTTFKHTDALNRYKGPHLANLQDVEVKTKMICKEWTENKHQNRGIMRVFLNIEHLHRLKKSDKLLIDESKWDMVVPLLENMSFWPVFKNSTQHLIDGRVDNTATSHQDHNAAVCMGVCSQQSIQEISETYQRSTTSEALETMHYFLDNLEDLREELLNDFSELIPFFKNLKPWQWLYFQKSSQHTLLCRHILDNFKFCADETTRKREKKKLKCRICSVLHTLAHLKFAIGTGSFHGKEKIGTEKTIDSFFSLVLMIEKSRNSEIDGSKELNDLHSYFDRLRRTANHIQSSCVSIISYSNCCKSIVISRRRMDISYLKDMFRSAQREARWNDNQLQNFVLDEYEKRFYSNKHIFGTLCGQLRYMINLYQNKDDWYKRDACPICFSNVEAFVNFPCGHNICENCYREYQKREPNKTCLNCVTCRLCYHNRATIVGRGEASQNPDDEGGVDEKDDREPAIPGVTLAVKLEATIKLMKKIMEEDPENNKILLLTAFEFNTPMWDYLTRILQKAKVPFGAAGFSVPCKIGLYPFSMCDAEGLHRSHANHIIILDPPQSLSPFEKAIADYQRDVKVYHMIVENSIDMQLWEMAKSGGQLKVGKIREMFGIGK